MNFIAEMWQGIAWLTEGTHGVMQGKTSINDEKLGTGAQPEDASLSDYYQFSRLLGEAPSDAEQRLVRKQRMSLGAPTDAGSSAYLQK